MKPYSTGGAGCRRLRSPESPRAQFSRLSARILKGEPITDRELQEFQSSLLEIVMLERPCPKRAKVIQFPSPSPEPKLDELSQRLLIEHLLARQTEPLP